MKYLKMLEKAITLLKGDLSYDKRAEARSILGELHQELRRQRSQSIRNEIEKAFAKKPEIGDKSSESQ